MCEGSFGTSNTINVSTKLHVYKSVMVSAAIYAADTWKKVNSFTHMLDIFHRRWLRIILGISRQDHVTSDELMKRAGMQDLSNIVKVRRLTLAGHILRLPSDRPASVAMQWVPDGGKRKKRRSSKTWQQTFQEDLHELRWESAGVVFAEWPVIRLGGKASSPSTPADLSLSVSESRVVIKQTHNDAYYTNIVQIPFADG